MTSARPRKLQHDPRTVLTLDAGGTKFTFCAIRGGNEVVAPRTRPSRGHDLDACLEEIVAGFEEVRDSAGAKVDAISFAFPGPADYASGIIGDLGNLPAFRGGVALGPMLEERFEVPVFINNDGDLFVYGEAMAGFLPYVNGLLEGVGGAKRFRNLLGVTLGTGFGGGIVTDGRLHLGDNGAGAEVWLLRNKLDRDCAAEEAVSIRGLQRAYASIAGLAPEETPEPKEIFEIGMGARPGDLAAAREAFRLFGEAAGDAVANAVTLVDGLVVLGGGLSGAAPLFLPALVQELNSSFGALSGHAHRRLESRAYNLEDESQLNAFLVGDAREIKVPHGYGTVSYDPLKRVGVGLSRLGTSRATSLGAYAFALDALDGASPPR